MFALKMQKKTSQMRFVGTMVPEKIDPNQLDATVALPDSRSVNLSDRELLEMANGVPSNQLKRTVVITQECKSPNQSGRNARQNKYTGMKITFS
jgi:hypothetical protein